MIFYTKLIKQKSFKTSAFTLFEVLIVVIIIGILVTSLSFNFSPNKLELARDQLIKDIRYTQSLALKDDKYIPFPLSNSKKDLNQSKYWFKSWWHLRITDSNDTIYYYIFSDKADDDTTNFDKKCEDQDELALNPLTKRYFIGIPRFPNQKYSPELNLSSYGVKRVEFSGYFASSMGNKGDRVHLLFDNLGNVYQDEGSEGDKGDINPLDSKRHLLTKNAKIKLCKDTQCNKCVAIEISPLGNVEKTNCN